MIPILHSLVTTLVSGINSLSTVFLVSSSFSKIFRRNGPQIQDLQVNDERLFFTSAKWCLSPILSNFFGFTPSSCGSVFVDQYLAKYCRSCWHYSLDQWNNSMNVVKFEVWLTIIAVDFLLTRKFDEFLKSSVNSQKSTTPWPSS